MHNELNDEWINNFEKTDRLYQDFYKDDVYYVNLKFVYVNRENEIEKINQESFLMSTPNYISREEIIQILKDSSTDNNKRYSLLSILKYNILLDAGVVPYLLHWAGTAQPRRRQPSALAKRNRDPSALGWAIVN